MSRADVTEPSGTTAVLTDQVIDYLAAQADVDGVLAMVAETRSGQGLSVASKSTQTGTDGTTWHCVHRDCGERHEVEGAWVDPQAPVRLRAVLQEHADTVHAGETRWPCTFLLTYSGGSTSVAYASPRPALVSWP